MSEAKLEQAQKLAQARLQTEAGRESRGKELRQLQEQLTQARETEQQVCG